jgi:hypothetical protein
MKRRKPQLSKTMELAKLGVEESEERILMRRLWLSILIHSCIYYELDDSLISDEVWNLMAHELVKLRDENPGIVKSMKFPDELRKFTPATGHDLPLRDPWVLSISQDLIRTRDRMKNTIRLDFRRVKNG